MNKVIIEEYFSFKTILAPIKNYLKNNKKCLKCSEREKTLFFFCRFKQKYKKIRNSKKEKNWGIDVEN